MLEADPKPPKPPKPRRLRWAVAGTPPSISKLTGATLIEARPPVAPLPCDPRDPRQTSLQLTPIDAIPVEQGGRLGAVRAKRRAP